MKKYFLILTTALILLGTVDKIDNDFIAIELYQQENIILEFPTHIFPYKLKEGDLLYLKKNKNKTLQILPTTRTKYDKKQKGKN